MGNRVTKTKEICDLDGNTVFIVLNRGIIPAGYILDSRSTTAVRIYSKKNDPTSVPLFIFYKYRNFNNAIYNTQKYMKVYCSNLKI